VTRTRAVPPLWIDLDGAHNVRDVGGLRAGPRTVRRGVLLRGDHLEGLSAAAADHLCGAVGLRAVVDLRAPSENPAPGAWMTGRGIERRHLPLVDLTRTVASLRRSADPDMVEVYGAMLDGAGPALVELLRFAGGPDRVPVLVHCAAGKDRTGIAVAVLLAAAGVDERDVVADYAVTGLRLDRIRRALLARGHLDAPVPAAVAPLDAAPIRAVLAAVAVAGGATTFLRRHGATGAELDRWRERLLD
jgi:protein-tyrosine phosphatase